MNSGTKNLKLAIQRAQVLADESGFLYYVFTPATSNGGPLWIERIPTWWEGKESQWIEEKKRQGGTIVYPAGK